jgi:hypothetical protein
MRAFAVYAEAMAKASAVVMAVMGGHARSRCSLAARGASAVAGAMEASAPRPAALPALGIRKTASVCTAGHGKPGAQNRRAYAAATPDLYGDRERPERQRQPKLRMAVLSLEYDRRKLQSAQVATLRRRYEERHAARRAAQDMGGKP